MSKENQENDVPEPGARAGDAQTFEGQNTEELPEVVVLDPESALPPGVTPDSAPTIVQEGDEDVYVILPEGDTSEIPVVETEVLDEAAETGDISASETSPLEVGVGTEAILQGDTASILNDATEALESQETQNLEELTSEIDDQVLAEEAGNTSEILAIQAGSLNDDEEGPKPLADSGVAPVAAPRSLFKILLAAAALLSVSAAAFWYLGGFGDQQTSIAGVLAPGGETALVVEPHTPVEVGTVPPQDPNHASSGGTTKPEDARLASKGAFHEKLVAALDLGLGVEVKHE